MKIVKDYLQKPKKDPHLHSPAHVLADELANKLGDPRHFGFYLKMATDMDHNVLRKLMGEVLEGTSSNPGALFAFLVKKYKREKNVSAGYSLWLMPEPVIAKALYQVIQSLAQAFDSPVFQPHIALLVGMEHAVPQALSGLSILAPFVVDAKAAKSGDAFFQALYLPVIKNKEMLAARRAAKKAFGISTNQKFEPHMTLLYANLPEDQKLDAAKEIITNMPQQIKFTQIALVKTTGQTEEFEIIKTLNLTAPA
jgi:hypothetical protein